MLSKGRPQKAVMWTQEMDAALVDLRAKYVGKRRCADAIGVAKETVDKRIAVLGLQGFRAGRRVRGATQ